MLLEFINAIVTLNTTGHYQLFSGMTKKGGRIKISLECKSAEGYNSQYFKIKQIVAEPGSQAYVRQFDIPSLEIAHKLIMMSIEEGGNCGKTGVVNQTILEELERNKSNNTNYSTPPTNSIDKTKQKTTNKILSIEPIGETAVPTDDSRGELDYDLESFMESGIKIANAKPITNGQEANKHRSAIESELDSLL